MDVARGWSYFEQAIRNVCVFGVLFGIDTESIDLEG